MKICTKCKEIKSLCSFYKRRASKDNLTSTCKCCIKANQAIYRKTEVGKAVQARCDKKYAETEAGKTCRRKKNIKSAIKRLTLELKQLSENQNK